LATTEMIDWLQLVLDEAIQQWTYHIMPWIFGFYQTMHI